MRDALLDQRADFLGLRDRGDDAALDLGRVVVELGVALGEEQGAGQVAQQGPLVAGIAAERAAFSSMSHGIALVVAMCAMLNVVAMQVRICDLQTPTAADGNRMPRCRPSSRSFSCTSLSVVSPKLRTSSSWSSVRLTRSRTVVMSSDSRQLRRPHRELQLGQAHVQLGFEGGVDAGAADGRAASAMHLRAQLGVLHERVEVLAEDLGRFDQGHLRARSMPLVQISSVSLS